jgi:lipopolysaccharide biosynthesis glycosyltransferase
VTYPSAANAAIVTVSDHGYLPAACCQLVSVANHLVSADRARLFLVVCDVSADDIANAERFFTQHGMSVEIVLPDFLDEMMPPLQTRWPRAAYLRLYFDRLFNQRWQRVVYFDADTRVCAPLSPLLTADLRGQPIGAVHDFIYYVTGNIRRRRRDLFLAGDAPYFQSGVMVFDWPAMLAVDGLGATRRFLAEHPEACYEAPDQDALNATFEGRWTPLDPRWNLHELYLMSGGKLEPRVMHFTSTKPWTRARPRAWREAAAWYRRELADSPWPDFVERQTIWQAAQADLRFSLRRYAPHLFVGLARHLPSLARRLAPERERRYQLGFLPWVPRRSRDVEDMAAALVMEANGSRPPLRPPEAVVATGHRSSLYASRPG